MKKSIFFKIFSINIIIIIVGVLFLTAIQSVTLSRYVYREQIGTLKNNARNIAGFIRQGTAPDKLDSFLFGFSRSTNTNILIIDNTGEILLASVLDDSFNTDIRRIDKKYTKDVLSNQEHIIKGTLGGVYSLDMFTLQVPIVSQPGQTVLGAIMISTATPEMNRMQSQLGKILVTSLFFVILFSFALSFALSRRISRPIKDISKTAKRFAQGDFSSRVEVDKKDSKIIEIDELTRSFNDMAFALHESDNIKNNFISDVSHELRTPMTTIGGFVDGILDETIPKEKHRDYLLIVKDEIVRLSELVNSFLNISRLQANSRTLSMSSFDINEIIRRTLVGFENKINEKEIVINVDFESSTCPVKADMNAIRQVMTNLIENAIKFTNHGGLLKISVRTMQQEVKVSVYNTGCGIAPEEQKLIFERFYKVDKSRSLNRSGTGLGLYIVKDILNRHGKDISVESREGEFAEFTFSLNRAKN